MLNLTTWYGVWIFTLLLIIHSKGYPCTELVLSSTRYQQDKEGTYTLMSYECQEHLVYGHNRSQGQFDYLYQFNVSSNIFWGIGSRLCENKVGLAVYDEADYPEDITSRWYEYNDLLSLEPTNAKLRCKGSVNILVIVTLAILSLLILVVVFLCCLKLCCSQCTHSERLVYPDPEYSMNTVTSGRLSNDVNNNGHSYIMSIFRVREEPTRTNHNRTQHSGHRTCNIRAARRRLSMSVNGESESTDVEAHVPRDLDCNIDTEDQSPQFEEESSDDECEAPPPPDYEQAMTHEVYSGSEPSCETDNIRNITSPPPPY